MLIIGLVLVSTALKNTQHEFAQQLQTDVLGTGGFLTWAAAILAIGAIGYLPGLRTASRYLLALLGVVIVVRNGGVFGNAQTALQQAISAGPAPAIPAPSGSSGSSSSSSSSGSSGSSGDSSSTFGTALKVAEIAAIA